MTYMDPTIARTRVKRCERKKLRSKFIGMIFKEFKEDYSGRKVHETDENLVVEFCSQRWPIKVLVLLSDRKMDDRNNPTVACRIRPLEPIRSESGEEAFWGLIDCIRGLVPGVGDKGNYDCYISERMTANEMIEKFGEHIETLLKRSASR